MAVGTWLLSRGKQRHGSAVQGNATPWYRQTAGDLNDLRARPVGHWRKLLAAFTAQRYWPSTCQRSRARVSAMEPTSSQKITGAGSRADEVNK